MVQLDPKDVVVVINKGGESRIARLNYALPHNDEHYCISFADESSMWFPRSRLDVNGYEMEIFYLNRDSIGEYLDSQKHKRGPEGLSERLLGMRMSSPNLELYGIADSPEHVWSILFPDRLYPLASSQSGGPVASSQQLCLDLQK